LQIYPATGTAEVVARKDSQPEERSHNKDHQGG